MKFFKQIIFFVILITNIQQINSQSFIIKLTDSVKNPIPNASIFLDNVKYSKKTNLKGIVSIEYKKKPKKITIMAPTLNIVELDYNDQKNITLMYDAVIEVKKIERKGKLKDNRDYRTIYDYIRAKVSGVTVSSDNKIIIRGSGTFNSSTEPLFILNGSPVSGIQDLNPFDVKTVTVLKGPEAAQYGVRGANGVIIIKTK